MAWHRTYDGFGVGSVVPAHDGGYVLVNSRHRGSEPDVPVRVVTIDESGAVRQQREIDPDVPRDARRARAGLIQTDDGYAVATGAWFATLDVDLSTETTGFAEEYGPNSTTHLAELPDGIAVASELGAPDHVSTRVFGFGSDGDLRWIRSYGEENSKWLGFLLAGPDGGVLVGGTGGEGWLASITADGTERQESNLPGALTDDGIDAATSGDGGFVLFDGSNAVRLTTAGEVDWQQSYDAFRDPFGGKIARTADGGYVLAVGTGFNRVGVARTGARGELQQWSYEYSVVDEGGIYLTDLVEHAPGEYLLVGARRESREGWAMLLSDSESPPPTPTMTTTPTRTPAPTPADPPTQSPTAEPAMSPGFGVGAALVGLVGGWLVRQR